MDAFECLLRQLNGGDFTVAQKLLDTVGRQARQVLGGKNGSLLVLSACYPRIGSTRM